MKITVNHNGEILDEFGFDKLFIDKFSEENVIKRLQFRPTKTYDFEYGIGGSPIDRYFKIKSIKLANNDTEIVVKVSENTGVEDWIK